MSAPLVIYLGGPWHGRYAYAGSGEFRVPIPTPFKVVELRSPLDPPESCDSGMRVVTYRRQRFMVPGWRFPLTVMTNWSPAAAAPDGVTVPGGIIGVPGECEPIPNLPAPVCTCTELMRRWWPHFRRSGVPSSACHLDHCRKHGPFREGP